MLEDQDIQKLIKVFATRDEIVSKLDLAELDQKFDVLQTSVDNYAKKS